MAMTIQVVYNGSQQRIVDGSLLEKYSGWFRDEITKAICNSQSTIVYQITNRGPKIDNIPVLVQIVPHSVAKVKAEKMEDDNEALLFMHQTARLYDTLFDLVEGKSSTMAAIPTNKLKPLIILAEHYAIAAFIRKEVKLHFMERPKVLYGSIIKDPPQFLMLGVKYQYGLMFREALVHCAGGFPGRVWPTQIQTLDPQLQAIIIEKALHLADWARRTEVELFMITFRTQGTNITVSSQLGKGQRELINLFREWLVARLRENSESPTHYERAVHFWRMWKRGDAYLPLAEVTEHFATQFGPRCHFDVRRYLGELKDEVQRVVRQIAAHKLDYCDREESEVDYLTCLQVDEQDYPWLARNKQ